MIGWDSTPYEKKSGKKGWVSGEGGDRPKGGKQRQKRFIGGEGKELGPKMLYHENFRKDFKETENGKKKEKKKGKKGGARERKGKKRKNC